MHWAAQEDCHHDRDARANELIERAQLRSEFGLAASDLAHVVPDLRGRLDVPPPPTTTPEEDRWRLLSSLSDVFCAISVRQRLLLVVEDLQWADRASLDLLLVLCRRLRGARMLVIGTFRDVEVDRAHAAAAQGYITAYLRSARDYDDAFIKRDPRARADVLPVLIATANFKDPTLYDRLVGTPISPDGQENLDSIQRHEPITLIFAVGRDRDPAEFGGLPANVRIEQ